MKRVANKILISLITLIITTAIVFILICSIPIKSGAIYDSEIDKYDPFYPTYNGDYGYNFAVPTLKDRLTVSTDGNTATLFAPYTTKEGGWYDANKNWQKDSALCWAASSSNLITWYLDVCEKTGYDNVEGLERDLYKIFDTFKNNWKDEGSDPGQGLSWYFNGHFAGGTAPENLENKSSGGYLSGLKNVGTDAFYQLNLGGTNPEMVFGNYEKKFPFYEDLQGHIGQDLPLSTHESFSRNVIRHLHYGASVIMVSKEGVSSFYSHAVTLWGCDYDVKTGLVNALYIADNDDGQTKLHTVPVTKRDGDSDGVKIKLYPEGPGDATPFTKVTSLTLLYAPGVVNGKTEHIHTPTKVENPATCEKEGTQTYYHCEDCGKYFEDESMTVQITDLSTWKENHKINKLEHVFSTPTYSWDETGCTAERQCQNCTYKESERTDFKTTVTPPTCQENGTKTHTATFKSSWSKPQSKVEIIPKVPHDFKDSHDETHHFKECIYCHTIKDKELHTFEEHNNITEKWKECTACHFIKDKKELNEDLAMGHYSHNNLEGNDLRIDISGVTAIAINGEIVPEEYYTVYTYYTLLRQNYLKTLDTGTYTLTVQKGDRYGKTQLVVFEQEPVVMPPCIMPEEEEPEIPGANIENPNKKVNIASAVFASVVAVAVIIAVAIIIFKKHHKK